MSRRLEAVVDRVRALPEADQEQIATWLDRLLEEERVWDELFARSQDTLEKLADEALAEDAAGETEDMTPERLDRG